MCTTNVRRTYIFFRSTQGLALASSITRYFTGSGQQPTVNRGDTAYYPVPRWYEERSSSSKIVESFVMRVRDHRHADGASQPTCMHLAEHLTFRFAKLCAV